MPEKCSAPASLIERDTHGMAVLVGDGKKGEKARKKKGKFDYERIDLSIF